MCNWAALIIIVLGLGLGLGLELGLVLELAEIHLRSNVFSIKFSISVLRFTILGLLLID